MNKKLLTVLITSLITTSLYADIDQGKKIYMKKLKSPCGIKGTDFTGKHTQDEWENIYESGKYKNEVLKLCPKLKEEKLKDKWIKDLYHFSWEYASDSGNVPSC